MAGINTRAGQTYATPEITAWMERTHVRHDEGLRLAYAAPATHDVPAIQVTPSEGQALGILVRLVQAERAVEVGALAGYSTIHIARALPPGGHLYSLEIDPRHARLAEEHLRAAGLEKRVSLVVGAAAETLPGLEAHGPFDVMFVDADKSSYDLYGRWAAANIRPGGLLVADNAFLFGRLLDDTPEAEAMRRFHTEAARSFTTTCLPTPEGMLLGLKR